MTEGIWVALIGLGGVLLGGGISIIGIIISTKAEKKNHIIKTRFDKEFEIYQELSANILAIVFSSKDVVKLLDRMIGYDNNEILKVLNDIKVCDETFTKCILQADYINRRYAPFIPKEMFSCFLSLIDKANDMNDYAKRLPYMDTETCKLAINDKFIDRWEVKRAIIVKQEELSNLSDETFEIVRKYLSGEKIKEAKHAKP